MTQVAACVARVLVEYVPGKQSVHAALPLLVLYFPATQPVHGPPFGPVKPALHVQAASAELPLAELELGSHARQVAASVAFVVVEYVRAAQFVHAAVPLVVLYFPATQPTHGPPFGPVKPALQSCAEARMTYINTNKARTSRMPHTPRAFISRI